MNAKDSSFASINRVAETHFFIRPFLEHSLKQQIIADGAKQFSLGANTYHEFWTKSLSDKFFDMGTFIRLGTALENSLKYYYMEKKGHNNLLDLKNDPNYQLNIFQRVLPWTHNSAIDLYRNELGIDLTQNQYLNSIQEIMLCRHLYAHNSGLLTEDFIDKYKRLTSFDILSLPNANTFPNQDTYCFEPLKRLNDFIEDSRRFIKMLP